MYCILKSLISYIIVFDQYDLVPLQHVPNTQIAQIGQAGGCRHAKMGSVQVKLMKQYFSDTAWILIFSRKIYAIITI